MAGWVVRGWFCGSLLVALWLPACGKSSAGRADAPVEATGGAGVAALGGTSGDAGRAGDTSLGGTAAAGATAAGDAGLAGMADAGASSDSCTDPDGLHAQTEYQERTTTTGLNGTFTDHCDDAGNLVEYFCEAKRAAGLNCDLPHPDPRCLDLIPTGQVIARSLECGGTCSDGACASHCPETGDELTYLTIDHDTGAATLANAAHDAEYSCAFGKDWQEGGYNCLTDPMVGDSMSATYHYSMTAFCIIGESFSVQLGNAGITECQYQCTRTH